MVLCGAAWAPGEDLLEKVLLDLLVCSVSSRVRGGGDVNVC